MGRMINVDVARRLDYLLGVPVCFFLSLLNGMRRVFSKKATVGPPKKIMFIGLSEIGSVVLAYPAIRKVHKAYPQAELYFLTFAENLEAVCLLDILPKENIIPIRNNNFLSLFIDTFRKISFLRRNNIDTVIDIELFSRFSSILSYLSAAKTIIGFHKYQLEGLYRGNFFTHKVIFNPYLHISQNFLALAESLKADPRDMPLVKEPLLAADMNLPLWASDVSARENILQKLKKENAQFDRKHIRIIINPDLKSRLPLRRWPKENYVLLIKKLLQSPDLFIILIGLNDQDTSLGIASERLVDLGGKTTVRELIDLFNVSQVFISHDSGAVHLASLTPIHIVTMFGPETKRLYGPLAQHKSVLCVDLACSPCFSSFNHRRSICKSNKCLQLITVDKVYDAVIRLKPHKNY